MFLVAAAGRMSREFIVRIPICFIEIITAMAMVTTKIFSISAFRIPRLAESEGLMLKSKS